MNQSLNRRFGRPFWQHMNRKTGFIVCTFCIATLSGGCGKSESAPKSDAPPTSQPTTQAPPAKPADDSKKPPAKSADNSSRPSSPQIPNTEPKQEPRRELSGPAAPPKDQQAQAPPALPVPPIGPAPDAGRAELPPVSPPPPRPAPPAPAPRESQPPVAVPRPNSVPGTELESLFARFMSEKRSTDELEDIASRIGVYLFDENDQIRAKLWELRNLALEKAAQTKFADDTVYRIHLLETGISNAAADERMRALLKEAAIILGISSAVGVASGLHVQPPNLSGVAKSTRNGLGWILSLPKRIFTRRQVEPGDASANRVSSLFRTRFRPASIDERLARDLTSVMKGDHQLVQKLNLTPIVDEEALATARLTSYESSNLRNVELAVIDEEGGLKHFLLRYSPKRTFTREEQSFFRSAAMPEEETRIYIERLKSGVDDPKIVLPGANNTEEPTRVSASRFANWSERAKAWRAGTADRFHRFDRDLAARRFVYTGGLLTAGYVLGSRAESLYSDIYLESLLADVNPNAQPPAQPKPQAGVR